MAAILSRPRYVKKEIMEFFGSSETISWHDVYILIQMTFTYDRKSSPYRTYDKPSPSEFWARYVICL